MCVCVREREREEREERGVGGVGCLKWNKVMHKDDTKGKSEHIKEGYGLPKICPLSQT